MKKSVFIPILASGLVCGCSMLGSLDVKILENPSNFKISQEAQTDMIESGDSLMQTGEYDKAFRCYQIANYEKGMKNAAKQSSLKDPDVGARMYEKLEEVE